MHYRNAKLDKFRQGRKLPHKREACRPLIAQVEQLVDRRSPKDFQAFVMPSATLFDIKVLTDLGVPEANIVAIENDPTSFLSIKKNTAVDLTDGPVDLGFRIGLEEDKKFDWMNLDLCGFIQPNLSQYILSLASASFTENCIVTVTVKCGREYREAKNFIWMLAKDAYSLGLPKANTLQEARQVALFYLCSVMPCGFGWYPQMVLYARYREDRQNETKGSFMLSCGVVYSQKENIDFLSLWNPSWT